jgi:4-diphosphocytidyl-2-C-methyl-D-erythritol kinase
LTPISAYARFVGSLGGGRVDADRLVELIENDFQPIVERAKPIVAETREQLLAAGAAIASLTGSGSAVYGIFDDRTAAASAHSQLTAKGIRSFHCRTRE